MCFLTLLLFSSHKHNTFLFHVHVQWKVNPKPAGQIQNCLILSSIMLNLSIESLLTRAKFVLWQIWLGVLPREHLQLWQHIVLTVICTLFLLHPLTLLSYMMTAVFLVP